ncbi:MAG TPA: tRNA pseudouridine(38-40) synthase TruA [Limnochorda sp.]
MRQERRVALVVEYDGTGFAGFQAQRGRARGQMTVHEALAAAVRRVTGEEPRLLAAGRTDAGVHALGQVVAFDTASSIPGNRFPQALNPYLPDGVVVRRSWEARPSFHPRYEAVSKEYRYLVLNRREPTALARRRAWWVPQALDEAAMKAAAAGLAGRHDFAAFASTGSSARTTVRTLYRLDVLVQEPWLVVVAEADGFLYRMVRRLVAGLVEVGRGRMTPEALVRRLEEPGLKPAVGTAPPWGLYLVRVRYPPEEPGGAGAGEGLTDALIDPLARM